MCEKITFRYIYKHELGQPNIIVEHSNMGKNHKKLERIVEFIKTTEIFKKYHKPGKQLCNIIFYDICRHDFSISPNIVESATGNNQALVNRFKMRLREGTFSMADPDWIEHTL